ncbi:hypothetical protein HAX54_033355, partial [Datura stramonium]|nr:hypothetical protein [Datura stramonium]
MVDHNTKKRSGLNFARLLVQVKIGAKLPYEMRFRNKKGIVISQPITYDWKSTLCKHCSNYGHDESVCRLKKRLSKNAKSQQE